MPIRTSGFFAGAVAAAALVGGAVWLSEASVAPLDTTCDLAAGPCLAQTEGGQRIQLDLTPRGVPTETPIRVDLRITPPPSELPKVVLQGAEMDMGILDVELRQREPGTYEGSLVVPVCTQESMTWGARVEAMNEHVDFGLRVFREESTGIEPTYPPFTLDTADGPLRLQDLKGQVVIVYFGFTRCPDICPTTLQTVSKALYGLAPDEAARVTGLLVSLDPERDSVEHLQSYTQFFHERIRGGTSSPEQISDIASSWGVSWRKVPLPESAMEYTIDHDARAFLVADDGHVVGFIRHGTSAESLLRQLKTLL